MRGEMRDRPSIMGLAYEIRALSKNVIERADELSGIVAELRATPSDTDLAAAKERPEKGETLRDLLTFSRDALDRTHAKLKRGIEALAGEVCPSNRWPGEEGDEEVEPSWTETRSEDYG